VGVVHQARLARLTGPCRDARGPNVLLLRRAQRPVGPDVEDAFDDVDPDFAAVAVAQEPPFDPKPRVVFGDPHRERMGAYSTKGGQGAISEIAARACRDSMRAEIALTQIAAGEPIGDGERDARVEA